MMDFENHLAYVSNTLALATDADLRGMRLLPQERDGLLAHEFSVAALGPEANPSWAGAFMPEASYQSQCNVIHYRHYRDDEPEKFDAARSLTVAAHEIYHAAKFWSKPFSQQTRTGYGSSLAFGPAFLAGLVKPLLSTANGSTLMTAGLATSAVLFAGAASSHIRQQAKINSARKKEELQAFRFGYLFNPDCYRPEAIKSHHLKPVSLLEKFKTAFVDGYPSAAECHNIFVATRKECLALPAAKQYGKNFSTCNMLGLAL